ncbi:hypothetical protein BGZ98_003236, partial [Dissophora globulifera]
NAVIPPATKVGVTPVTKPLMSKVAISVASKPSTSNTAQKTAVGSISDGDAGQDDNAPKKRRRVSSPSAGTAKPKKKAQDLEVVADDGKPRCIWAASSRYPLLQQYHDTEWCITGGFDRSNRYLFEMLILEGAQAGLSWSTVLHKREAYREAYDNFDYNIIADTYTSPASNERLLQTNIVKNRLKVEASMVNAKAFRDLLQELYPDQAQPQDENGFWQFLQAYAVKSLTKNKNKSEPSVFVTRNESSDRLSADLKKRGFKFVGTTIMYAYLQAIGIDLGRNQHFSDCYRYKETI